MELAACTQANCNKWQWQCTNKACGAIVLSPVCILVFFPENVLAPSNPMPTILLTWRFLSFKHYTLKQKKMLSAFACFRWVISKKCSSGESLSSQWQYTDISLMTAMSVHSPAMILKRVALRRCFSKHYSTRVARASMNSITATCMWSIHRISPYLAQKNFQSFSITSNQCH